MTEQAWLEGRISVEAAILGQNRVVEKVFIHDSKKDRSIRKMLQLAKSLSIAVQFENEAFFADHAEGKSHGGVLALVGPRRFSDLGEILAKDKVPMVVMLDGIEDPFNFGQAVRALYAGGASGLIVRKRNWLSAAGVVTRSSAGASELMPTAVVDSALEAAHFFRKRGLLVGCTARGSAVSLFDADLTMPLFLLIGGEKRGITRSFIDQTDLRLQIPYGRSFDQSLGVVASTAILAFEILRQRGPIP